MAIYTANKPVKTLTLHKNGCRVIPLDDLKPCGCGDTGAKGNQRWYCEEHISIDQVNNFENGRYWAILLCDLCFREV